MNQSVSGIHPTKGRTEVDNCINNVDRYCKCTKGLMSTYVIDTLVDLWFGFVLEIGPLGPVEWDRASCLLKTDKINQTIRLLS